MKDLPSIAESGYPDFEAVAWNGFVAPTGITTDVIDVLNRDINAILADAEVRQRIESSGWDIAGGTPQQFADFMAKERTRWQPVIARSGARLD